MLNNYAEGGGGFSSNHGQTSRPTEAQKQQNIGSSWSYNSQLEGMYYGSDQPMYMGPYDSSAKHTNYPQYPHQPVPTPVVKCHEACCQHFQDRYPLNPAPLRYQPSGPVQPRYEDSRQYFTDRRSMQPTLTRKKTYPAENGFPGITDRHYSQFMGRGQFMPDSRQQMQMMRSQYPMYPPYWGSARGWSGPRMNCPPPPYHQSVSQGAHQLQAGLKMTDSAHYMDPTQKPLSTQRHRTVGPTGGSEVIRPVPEPKRSTLDSNLQSCYEFGYPAGFVPFGDVGKIQGSSVSQNSNSSCKIPSDKQCHPHQMQYSIPTNDRNMMNCSNPISDLSYSMNFPLSSGDPYIRPGLDDGQSISDSRKLNLQYDSSLGKKRPDLDLRQYLATWEDDEDESTRLSEPVTLGNSGAPYIVVDCRSLEGEAAAKIQERFKTSQNCASKPRSSSPSGECKRTDEQNRPGENSEGSSLHSEFQNQTTYAPSMPNLLSENDKGVGFWNGTERDGEGISGKGSAFQPLDCSKRDNSVDSSKRDSQVHGEISANKVPGNSESGNVSFDALVSYYGDSRRMSDGGYDFVEMTERLVNNADKSAVNNHQVPPAMTRPCDPRLQQSQLGNNPSIYNKVAPRYSSNNYQHFKPSLTSDPYNSYKHPMTPSKYFGYDSSQVIDPNYEYHKIASEYDPTRLYSNKETSKDPRRIFHQELDKSTEGNFLDPIRKAHLSDCYQGKAPCEFTGTDPDPFISPIIIKKSDLNSRDKVYPDKNNTIRERMDVINSENQNHSDKTVLITSQDGPPEVFRVPYSPEKDLSHKDNVVTLHSGDQTKSNTITVEVPYVQQYSTLVKLSEEISRAQDIDEKSKAKSNETSSSKITSNDEAKKPTSFKLKRLPNSKEWAVEGKGLNESNKRMGLENNVATESTSTFDVPEERDDLKSSVTVSNLNMPSLDDIREEENCDTVSDNHSINKLSDGPLCSNKICGNTGEDSNKISKYNSQPPQMAIVQPMKLTNSDPKKLDSNQNSKIATKVSKDSRVHKSIRSTDASNPSQSSFHSEELISSSSSHLELISENNISKHENFRSHKKIQSFPTTLPNCLPSPSEEFLHSQDIGAAESQKEPYSPFHVYSDCDMNSQINDFFKIDDRNASTDKMLDNRMPSSPGVEGMFEDINHSNTNNLYQPKSCNFQDITDSTIPTLTSHNDHFQSFSTIFSEEADKRRRLDGSVLQRNEKKCFKNVLGDIENQPLTQSDSNSLKQEKSDESKNSPLIPPISLKLNESKKMWCIANKDQHADLSIVESTLNSKSLGQESLDMDAENELEKDLAQAIDEEKRKSSENYNFGEVQSDSEINQLLSSGITKDTSPNILADGSTLTQPIHNKSFISEYSNCLKINTDLEQQIENKCLSITKYYPRNKIFGRISALHKTCNKLSTTLVFDENGTHFPVIDEQAKINEGKLIVKDIIDYLISKSIVNSYETEKINVAHVAPFSENLITSENKSEAEDTKEVCNVEIKNVETVIKYETSHFSKERDNSIAKATEIFIQHEKENYQHHSVIKSIPVANHIVATLRKPVRSIFSPRSDDGSEDDESFERNSDSHAITFTQGSSLKIRTFKTPDNQDHMDCSDLNDTENSQRNHSVNHDLSYSSETAHKKVSFIELNGDRSSHFINDNRVLGTNIVDSKEFGGFASKKTAPSKNYALDKNSSEIDYALELMGLSNTRTVESMSENIEHFNSCKLTAKSSLFHSEESLGKDSGLEEQLAPKEDNAQLLYKKKMIREHQEIDRNNEELLIPMQTENICCTEENGISVKNQVFELGNYNPAMTDPIKSTCHVGGNVISADTEQNNPGDSLGASAIQLVNSSETFLNTTNSKQGDDQNSLKLKINSDTSLSNTKNSDCCQEIVLSASPCQKVFSERQLSTVTEKGLDSVGKATKGKVHPEDMEDRLETSVIVRNKTFNSLASRNVSGVFANVYNSFSGDTESVYNVKNIINEVITDAVSRNIENKKFCLENPLNDYQLDEIKHTKDNCFVSEDVSLSNNNERMDYKNNSDETFDGCAVVFNEVHDLGSIKCLEEKDERIKMCFHKKESVIISKVILPLNSISEIVDCSNLPRKLVYCVSESVFLNLNEETSTFIETSKSSYFHEFKKRKWQKFYKPRDVKLKENLHIQREEFESDFTFENYHSKAKKHLLSTKQLDNCTFGRTCIIDTSESEKSVPFIDSGLVCPDTQSEDKNFLDNQPKKYVHSTFENSPKEFKTSEIETVQHINSETINFNKITRDKDISNVNEVQDCSVPLKDKFHFFNQKETNSFLRRDSLKLLEREAVLREIFSPDPETDDSEYKENECPENYSQLRQDSPSPHRQLDAGSFLPDTNVSSSTSASSHQNLSDSTESDINLVQTVQQKIALELSNFHAPHFTSIQITGHNQKALIPSGDLIMTPHNSSYIEDCNESSCDCSNTNTTRSEAEKSSELGLKKSTVISSLNSEIHAFKNCNTESVKEKLHEGFEEMSPRSNSSDSPQPTSHDDNVPGCVGDENTAPLIIKNNTNSRFSIIENGGAIEISNEKNKYDSPLLGAKNISSYQIAQQDIDPDSSRTGSSEESPIHNICQGKESLISDQVGIIHHPEVDKTSISYYQDSNTNVLSIKLSPDEKTAAMSVVTGKDVLFSTTQTSEDQDDETFNSNLHSKERDVSVDEDENAVDCQNEKINSVQDSLKNNHNLNRDNFPLQCLVEAALALEHVDSKQMLLNNSKFSGLYSQSDEGFVESPLSDSPSHDNLEYSIKQTTSIINNSAVINDKNYAQSESTTTDKDIFSKLEETNYNLRASTRIVTSSSSNIIPYSKRKYGLKSSKSPSNAPEIKQKKTETLVSEKNKNRKRRTGFTYPRSKRRRKVSKDKQKCVEVLPKSANEDNIEKNTNNNIVFEALQNNFDKENILENQAESVELESEDLDNVPYDAHCLSFKSNSQVTDAGSKNDFGGPLLIASENTSSQGNIFCVHVESEKMDDYVNNLNVGELGILSDNHHSVFKDSNTDNINSDIPNVNLDNGTSLVIIIEELDENTEKNHYDENCKSESDVMLGSVRDADCSDVLTTELSVNESCICPPGIGMKGLCESELKAKSPYDRSDELLTTNCYEEINENLINDIGNWPFVEEEVAEFDSKCELPNQIPEEGRKIELKCSLPWKKIFNIAKGKKKKNKASRKSSGLELGPAKVEVRLRAPSAEWKVIGDYHENSSPVVKVSRLILQRDSDNSSYSEKDSEEENEHKKQLSEHTDPKESSTSSYDSLLSENISKNENWQPIVVLKRSKELDELTLALEAKLRSQTSSSVCNSQSSSSDDEKDGETSDDSDSDSSCIVNENDRYSCSQFRESSTYSEIFGNKLNTDASKKYIENDRYEIIENDSVPYEKYSPTGCSNALGNEKIYSPSNPHFSPGEVYPDSDGNSNCGGENVCTNSEDANDDVFLDVATHKLETQITQPENKTEEISHSHNNGVDHLEEESNLTNLNKAQDRTEVISQSSHLSESSTDTIQASSSSHDHDIKEILSLNCTNSEEDMLHRTVAYKSCARSNVLNTSNEINATSELPREILYEQTKKTRRKMPKNFFVRKKLRKNLSETDINSDISSKEFGIEKSSLDSLPSKEVVNSPTSPLIAQNEFQSTNHTAISEESKRNSESDISVACDDSRLQCVYDLDDSSPTQLNESPSPEKFEEKQTLRNCARGLKRPCEGHSKEDTKRRRKRLRSHSNTCQECDIKFKNKEELTRHNAYRHARRRELHHCLLCQRSFSSAVRHSLHVQGRSHRHLELTQRHTMHAMHRLLVGRDCPVVPPLSFAEQRTLHWRPAQPGYTHFYHDLTPLQTMLQEHNSGVSEDTTLSEEKVPND